MRWFFQKICFVLISSSIISCASDNEVKEIDTKLDVKTHYDGKEVGLNDDNEAVVQEKTAAADEMRALEMSNARLMDRLETDYNELKRCREDLADSLLGGNGEVRDIPEIDKMKDPSSVKEEFGVDEAGKLTVVKKENFKDKLELEQKFQGTIKTMQKTVSAHRIECERRMRTARVKAGLPAQRYTAQGYFDGNGTWVETREAEVTLDDARRIKAKETKRAPAPAAEPEQDTPANEESAL